MRKEESMRAGGGVSAGRPGEEPWNRAGLALLILGGALAFACSSSGPPPKTSPPTSPEASSEGSAAGPAAGSRAMEPPRLVAVSWDGAADWVLDRLLEEEALPNLAELARDGVRAAHSLAPFPSKTAPGHATLWTGCWPATHGVTGNSVPAIASGDHSLGASRNGFLSESLTAEPLYLTAALEGLSVAVLSATHVWPTEKHHRVLDAAGIPRENLLLFDGFRHRFGRRGFIGPEDLKAVSAEAAASVWAAAGVPLTGALEGDAGFGDSSYPFLVADDPSDPVEGLDTVLILGPGGKLHRLKPRPASEDALDAWSPPLPIREGELEGNTLFRLFALAPDGSAFFLYRRAASAILSAGDAERAAAYGRAYPAFHDDPFRAYDRGLFGPGLAEGGDGTAEAMVLELAALDVELATEGVRFALEAWRPDLLFHYSPLSDSAGHSWMGYLDPDLEGHDEALAERLWPYYRRVFQHLDRWLGVIREVTGPETIVALVSDHGMEGVARTIYPNEILRQADLLATDGEGRIALEESRVLMPSFGAFFLTVNDSGRPGGTVSPDDEEAVLAAAEEALLEARDPETGGRLFRDVLRPWELTAYGAGGATGGDLYLNPMPGYTASDRLPRDGAVAGPLQNPRGDHGFLPERRKMHAIFYAAGPGLKQGVEVPPGRHIDVAPTLARALHLRFPAQACGAPLEEAFSK